jgi:hypothetical protein
MLDQPFTLVYNYVTTDIRTQAIKDKVLADMRASAQKRIDADELTQQDLDDAIRKERERMARPTAPGRLTISFDGRTLIVDTDHLDTPEEEQVVLIRDGKTYLFYPRNEHVAADRTDGVLPYGFYDLPFIGPSLPFAPAWKNGKVLVVLAAPFTKTEGKLNRLVYGDGLVKTDKRGAVLQVRLGKNGANDRFELSGHVRLHDRWVAKTIAWTRRHPIDYWPEVHYSLAVASPIPLPADSFLPDHYLPDGATVQVNFSGGHNITFPYRKAKGSYETQEHVALRNGQ